MPKYWCNKSTFINGYGIETGHECIGIRDNDTKIICRGINITKSNTKTTKEAKIFDDIETEFDVIDMECNGKIS